MSDFDLSARRAARLRRAESLASKISLLLDTIRTGSGKSLDYPAIRDAAQKEAGYYISRTRWSLLKAGKEQVVPEEALRALATVFDVKPQYLLKEDAELPHQVKANLEHVRRNRRAEVRDFTAQALGQVDPEAFRAVARILDEEPRALPGGSTYGVECDE